MADRLRLEHSLPGRARLRLPKPRTAAAVQRAARRLERMPRVHRVEANQDTGSLFLHFDEEHPLDDLLHDVRDLGFELAVAARQTPTRGRRSPKSQGARALQGALGKLNADLHRATDGTVDLRLLVPAGFALLAARAAIRDAGRIRDASWYQLAYWAFDSFHKLHDEGGTDATA